MKLDKSCCFFNAKIGERGNSSNWTTSLSKQSGDYSFDDETKRVFYKKIQEYYIQENEGKALYTSADTRPGPEIKGVAILNEVYFGDHKVASPFIIAVIKDVKGSHAGRLRLKINHDFEVEGNTNQKVYNQIQTSFGENACWFLDSMHFHDGKLILSPFLVSTEYRSYPNADVKGMHWNGLQGDHKKTINFFKSFEVCQN